MHVSLTFPVMWIKLIIVEYNGQLIKRAFLFWFIDYSNLYAVDQIVENFIKTCTTILFQAAQFLPLIDNVTA